MPCLNGIDLSAVSLDGSMQPLVIAFRDHVIEHFQQRFDATVVSQPSRAALRQGWYWSSLS
jgi:hypothetical protein